MNRLHALNLLKTIKPTLIQQFGVTQLALFGSTARDEATENSDVSEVRGDKAPRIKRLSEYLGDSYFNYLAGLPDLVLLMDESHRYRADAGVRALNELNPLLGLELTATPFTEFNKGSVPFKNVVVDYPLVRAMDDGFVKEPAVVTQRNFDPSQHSAADIERIKLMDGIRLHETTKVELLTYAHENDLSVVKPFMLVIARDIVQAKADAASKWCQNASEYLLKNGGKPWKYVLIPHDEVKENFQLGDYLHKFVVTIQRRLGDSRNPTRRLIKR